jgi:hypothetical protein
MEVQDGIRPQETQLACGWMMNGSKLNLGLACRGVNLCVAGTTTLSPKL